MLPGPSAQSPVPVPGTCTETRLSTRFGAACLDPALRRRQEAGIWHGARESGRCNEASAVRLLTSFHLSARDGAACLGPALGRRQGPCFARSCTEGRLGAAFLPARAGAACLGPRGSGLGTRGGIPLRRDSGTMLDAVTLPPPVAGLEGPRGRSGSQVCGPSAQPPTATRLALPHLRARPPPIRRRLF